MKQLLLMLVMLFSSITYAQDFSFSCGPTAAEILKSERIMELEVLGDGVVTLTVTITTSNGVVDGYKSSIYNDGVFYDAYLIGTAIELQSKESFDTNVTNMKSIVDGLIDDNYQAANALRNARLDYIQTLATGNTVITVSEDPTYAGDYFNISHDGPNPPTYYNYRVTGGAYVQDISDELVPGGQGATYLSQFYDGFATWVMFAQGEYDASGAAAALIAKRNDFISQLETAFLLHETEIISINLTKDGNDNDVISITTSHDDVSLNLPFGALLEEISEADLKLSIDGLEAWVENVQNSYNSKLEDIAEAVESFTGYTNDELDEEIDNLVNSNLTGGTKGIAIKGLFWGLVGQTALSGKPIIDVTTTYVGTPDFYIQISIYTDVTSGTFVTVLGPVNVYYSEITAEQLKYLYLDAAQQAADL